MYRLGALLLLVLGGSIAPAVVQTTAALGSTRTDAGPGARGLTSKSHGSLLLRLPSVDAGPRVLSPFPRYGGGLPVLLYHRLVPSADGYSVAPASFDAQLQRLHDLGFEAITLAQYVRFVRGDAVDLPPRPILITFDDGYVSSWANADPVLARYGWSAVMYVITGAVGRPGHLTWEELRQMQWSRRWQIDEHADHGHVLITADAAGRRLPFYASERFVAGKKESFAHYKQRVSSDIQRGSAMLSHNLVGTPHVSFAVPFNNYGQNGSNDPRIEPWLRGYLKSRFTVIFVQAADDRFATPTPGFADRITVSSHWDADTLEAHLLHGFDELKSSHRR